MKFFDAFYFPTHRLLPVSHYQCVTAPLIRWIKAYFPVTRFQDRKNEMFVPLTSTRDPNYEKRRQYVVDRVQNGIEQEVMIEDHDCVFLIKGPTRRLRSERSYAFILFIVVCLGRVSLKIWGSAQ